MEELFLLTRHGCVQSHSDFRRARFLAVVFSPRTRRSLPTGNEKQSKPHWRNATGAFQVPEVPLPSWEYPTKLLSRRSQASASTRAASRRVLQKDARTSAAYRNIFTRLLSDCLRSS